MTRLWHFERGYGSRWTFAELVAAYGASAMDICVDGKGDAYLPGEDGDWIRITNEDMRVVFDG